MLFLNYAFLMPQNAKNAKRNASIMGLSLVVVMLEHHTSVATITFPYFITKFHILA